MCVCIYALVAHHRVGVQTEAYSAMSAVYNLYICIYIYICMYVYMCMYISARHAPSR